MHRFISFNQQIQIVENASLAAASNAALYGKSVFTTVAVYNFKIFQWEKHWTRLTENARKIGIDAYDFTERTTKDSLDEIVGKNNVRNGRARLTFFDESGTGIWQTASKNRTSFLIQTADFRLIESELKLTVSVFPVNSQSPLIGVKSGNYLENILAFEDARGRGFDEAIRVNEKGEVTSACLANIFWKKDGTIFTPSLATGCLKGTTRAFFLENQAVVETSVKLDELLKAGEIFLTSAGIGIVKARVIE